MFKYWNYAVLVHLLKYIFEVLVLDISIICFFIFALYITTIRQCPLSRCDL